MQSRLFAAPTPFKRTRFCEVDTVHFGGLENGAGDGIRLGSRVALRGVRGARLLRGYMMGMNTREGASTLSKCEIIRSQYGLPHDGA